jgi:hypothetical protein
MFSMELADAVDG